MNNDPNYYTLTKTIVKSQFLSTQVITVPGQVKENFTCPNGQVAQKVNVKPWCITLCEVSFFKAAGLCQSYIALL